MCIDLEANAWVVRSKLCCIVSAWLGVFGVVLCYYYKRVSFSFKVFLSYPYAGLRVRDITSLSFEISIQLFLFLFLFTNCCCSDCPYVPRAKKEIRDYLLFLMFSLNPCINTSMQSSMLSSPLPPFLLDTYYLSMSSPRCKAFCIVINFLFLWSVWLSSSFVYFKNGLEYLTKGTAQVFTSD